VLNIKNIYSQNKNFEFCDSIISKLKYDKHNTDSAIKNAYSFSINSKLDDSFKLSYQIYPVKNIVLDLTKFCLRQDSIIKKVIIFDSINNIIFSYNFISISMFNKNVILFPYNKFKNAERIDFFQLRQFGSTFPEVFFVGLYEEGDYIFYDSNGKVFSSIVNIIISKFGTLEKFIELEIMANVRSDVAKCFSFTNYSQALEILKTDWKSRSNYLPIDTIGNINLVTKFVKKYCNISEEEIALFEFDLLNELKNPKNSLCENSAFSFYNINFYYTLKKILTGKKFETLLIYFESFQHARNIAIDFIVQNIHEKNFSLPESEKSKIYDKILISNYQNLK
jgi:hypothetical protein